MSLFPVLVPLARVASVVAKTSDVFSGSGCGFSAGSVGVGGT